MPVVAESVTAPTEQDRIDLEKTYEGDIHWLDAALTGSDQIVAGRFNDRLVAAFRLHDGATHWQLDKLQVRAITRRRGVARQTLNSALKTLEIKRPVQVDLNQHPELIALFSELGFQPLDGGLYQWQP